MVPNGWEVGTVQDLCTLKRGFDLPVQNRIDGGVPIYSANGITGYHNEAKIQGPNVITGRSGTVGKIHFTHDAIWPLNTSLYVDNFHGNSPEYVFRFLDYFKLERFASGTGVPTLNRNDVHPIKITIPPLPEQRKIAQILSIWDRGIATTEKLIDASKQQKKALMQQLLTGKKRLVNPETGKAFEGDWERKRVGDVTKKFANKNKESANITVFSVTNNAGFVKQNEHFSKEVASEDRSTYKIVQCGDFAYNPARINVGSIARFDQDIGIISSLYVCFQLSASVQSDFFLQWLSTEKTIFDYSRYGEGSVRVYLWYEQFSMIEILLPSLDEQQKIVSVLTAADKEIELLEAKLLHLKQEKKALMQQLLTGKRRVSLSS
ncbi:restriction endonuclease subunit S [Vibrio diabolicus]|uniref:restriction endonuclease subunit S n=1 Tax=Vibrio diabolicus TaxID=50719 RepID=UPI003B5B3C17